MKRVGSDPNNADLDDVDAVVETHRQSETHNTSQPPQNHALGGAIHDASTRAAINALVSDAVLESESGAQSKADSAESAAESYADGEIENHRQNETHSAAQPPQLHGDSEHDGSVPSQNVGVQQPVFSTTGDVPAGITKGETVYVDGDGIYVEDGT